MHASYVYLRNVPSFTSTYSTESLLGYDLKHQEHVASFCRKKSPSGEGDFHIKGCCFGGKACPQFRNNIVAEYTPFTEKLHMLTEYTTHTIVKCLLSYFFGSISLKYSKSYTGGAFEDNDNLRGF